ncbi:hypothetical protein ACFQZ0_03325 [Streptomyces erythrogriseus]
MPAGGPHRQDDRASRGDTGCRQEARRAAGPLPGARSRSRSKALSGTPRSALPGGRRGTPGCGRVGAVARTASHAAPIRRSLRSSNAVRSRGSSSSSSSRMS